jgi:hypothetical protein
MTGCSFIRSFLLLVARLLGALAATSASLARDLAETSPPCVAANRSQPYASLAAKHGNALNATRVVGCGGSRSREGSRAVAAAAVGREDPVAVYSKTC